MTINTVCDPGLNPDLKKLIYFICYKGYYSKQAQYESLLQTNNSTVSC